MVGWHGVQKWQLPCHSVPGTSAWVEVASWGLESIPPADTGGQPPKTDVVITFPAVGLQLDDQGGCAGG